MAASPDLAAAASAVDTAKGVVDACARHLAAAGKGAVDTHQVVAYDLAHAAAAVENARAFLEYGSLGKVEAGMACAFAADAVFDVITRTFGREQEWGIESGALNATHDFVRTFRSPEFLASLAGQQGPRHLDADFEMVQDTFRRFAQEK